MFDDKSSPQRVSAGGRKDIKQNNKPENKRLNAIHVAIGKGLIRRAETEGRDLDSFVAEWVRHCQALNQPPMSVPELILILGDIDRHCKNKHGPKELDVERQAFVVHKRKTEGLRAV